MARRKLFVSAAVLFGLVFVGLGAYALAPAMRNQAMYGTVSTEGTPPLIRYCDRTYLPAPITATQSRREVDEFLATNGLHGLEPIGTTPSGMPVMTNFIPPAARASTHTAVCTMGIWVETGPDRYLAYGLSGGP
jgi:hypothetical protein